MTFVPSGFVQNGIWWPVPIQPPEPMDWQETQVLSVPLGFVPHLTPSGWVLVKTWNQIECAPAYWWQVPRSQTAPPICPYGQHVQWVPVQDQPVLLPQYVPTLPPLSIGHGHGHGQASPAAIEHLRSIGLDWNPLSIPSPVAALPPGPITHPTSLFPPAREPDSVNFPGKHVLVDVDALAKILRKTVSAETILVRKEDRGDRFYHKDPTDSSPVINWDSNRWKSSWNSDDYEGLQRTRARSYDRLKSFWESDLFSGCYRGDRLSLQEPLALKGTVTKSSSFTRMRPGLTPGPPRHNDGTGSPLDLFGSYHDRCRVKYRRSPEVIGNLPYRFPSRTTLSLYPMSSRSTSSLLESQERTDTPTLTGLRNIGLRNLSVNHDPFGDIPLYSGCASAPARRVRDSYRR